MHSFIDGFRGGNRNLDSNFMPYCDDEDRFNLNLKKQPDDWVYRTQPVHYRHNNYGFRIGSESLDDDYILFSGCSHTEGIGIALEHTYSYLVANTLNKTYYNLGVGGSGIDLLAQNMLTFLSCNKKPSKIIIQWPNRHRFYAILGEDSSNGLKFFNPGISDYGSKSEVHLWKALTETNVAANKNTITRMHLLTILHNMQIEVCEVFLHLGENGDEMTPYYQGNTSKVHKNHFLFGYNDRARDMSHMGIKDNQNLSDMIVSAIENNLTPSA